MVNDFSNALPSLPTLSDLASSIAANQIVPGLGDAVALGTGQATSSGTTSNLTRAIVIILGLLFIAAGIFSFDKVREVIVQTGRTAATAA